MVTCKNMSEVPFPWLLGLPKRSFESEVLTVNSVGLYPLWLFSSTSQHRAPPLEFGHSEAPPLEFGCSEAQSFVPTWNNARSNSYSCVPSMTLLGIETFGLFQVAAKCYQKGGALEKEKLALAHNTALNMKSKKVSLK